MNYLNKVKKDELVNCLPSRFAFICFASFEERCTTVPLCLNVNSINKSYVFRNINPSMISENETNYLAICENIHGISPVELDLSDSVSIADTVFTIIKSMIDKHIDILVADISTFTHETLLILLNALYINKNHFAEIYLTYNGASEYSKWLSKGCKEIRNVIGYPGIFKPSQKYHLIVLTGFERERATRLVELLEPDILSIGNGVDAVDNNHIDAMGDMKNEFEKWLKNLQGISNSGFDFSCTDIKSTINQLKNIINQQPDENYILVPLNTKLSTVSVALIALKNRKIQVCYPIPEVYNTSYSKPSDNIAIIDLKKIDEFVT